MPVDRLWPRGLCRAHVARDDWIKGISRRLPACGYGLATRLIVGRNSSDALGPTCSNTGRRETTSVRRWGHRRSRSFTVRMTRRTMMPLF
jgi:hypothetical protein